MAGPGEGSGADRLSRVGACTARGTASDSQVLADADRPGARERTDLRFEPLGAVALGGLPEWEPFEASIG